MCIFYTLNYFLVTFFIFKQIERWLFIFYPCLMKFEYTVITIVTEGNLIRLKD